MDGIVWQLILMDWQNYATINQNHFIWVHSHIPTISCSYSHNVVGLYYDDICSNAMTEAEHKSGFELINDTP